MELNDMARNIQRQISMTQSLVPHIRTLEMMQAQALVPQRLLPDISGVSRVSELANISHRFVSEFNVLQKVVEQSNLIQGLLPEVSILQKMIEQVAVPASLLLNANIPSLAVENTSALMWAYLSLSELPWTNLGSLLKLNEVSRTALGNSFIDFSNSYFALSESLEKTDWGLGLTSATSIFELPEIELFNEVDLLNSITVGNAADEETDEDAENKQSLRDKISAQTVESLEILLASLDKKLIRIWQGANQALISENVDKSRHVLISLRELFTQVLHQLAPDNEVRTWATTSPEFFDEKGRPTRRARLLFIYGEINSSPFRSFVEKDVASILKLWEILNRVHEVSISLTQKQLVALKVRTESTLRLLLVTRKLS